jgi:glycosyltransferase involved in cell wall biosynthesis
VARLIERNKNLEQEVNGLKQRNSQWETEVRELRGENATRKIIWPVSVDDLVAADLSSIKPSEAQTRRKSPYRINWVLPPTGSASGGMVDILRCIQYLEEKGHICRVYFYDPLNQTTLDGLKTVLRQYPTIKAKLYHNAKTMAECDAIFATNWYTAYPVYNFVGDAKKFYFVQDYEPLFDPAGSYSTLAQNTYDLGLHGVVLGKWLQKKLRTEHGMKADYFDFGIDPGLYSLNNFGSRQKVFFYARPVTPRRGFELGILALELFHKEHPEFEIHLLGWDLSQFQLNFPYVSHGVMTSQELNQLYNESAAGLVFSFTNMSLLPPEMIAAGCVPVVNEAEHTHVVNYERYIKYATPTPTGVARALHEAVTEPKTKAQMEEASRFVQAQVWDRINDKIERVLKRELSGATD